MGWLFRTPMVRAYVTLVASYVSVSIAIAIMAGVYINSVDNRVAGVAERAKVGGHDGKVSTAELRDGIDYAPYAQWLILSMLAIVVGGGLLSRLTLGKQTLIATDLLVADATAAAQGDLSVSSRVVMDNEYGQAQRSLAAMLTSFNSTVTRIDRAASELTSAASEMAMTADESGHAVGEVAQAMSSISEGAGHQARLILEASDVLGEIENSIRDASEHSHQAQLQIADTERLSERGVELVAQAQQAMSDVRDSASQTALAVRSLGFKSGDIDQIVQAISGISAQTNMLALNASIEAARAGDQGRGFANVAEEVRLLAEEAHDSAERIAALIDDIQDQTDKAVVAMEAGVERVEAGFDAVNRDRATFTEIGAEVHALTEAATQVHELADEIAADTVKVREQIEQVATVAEQSSAATQQVSASTQQTSAAAEQVSASAQRVAETAAALAAVAGRFKLK